MWVLYPFLVVLAGVAFAFGLVPVGILVLLALGGAIAYGALSGGADPKDDSEAVRRKGGGEAEGMPSTREAAYEPIENPRRSGA